MKISNGITKIPTQAFYKCSSLDNIVIPQSVTEIGNFAFADCSSLKSIVIPENTRSIAANAFLNHADDLTIYCNKNSTAHQYAIDNSIDFILIDGYNFGDVSLDGNTNIVDATLIQRYVVGVTQINKQQLYIADINGDGIVNVVDSTTLQKILVGLA